MAELVGDMFRGMPWYLFFVIILAFGLLIASFIVPPVGTVSPSVLQGIAIILGFTWLLYVTANIPVFVERGAKIKASYGNAQIEIGKHHKDETVRAENQLQEEKENCYD